MRGKGVVSTIVAVLGVSAMLWVFAAAAQAEWIVDGAVLGTTTKQSAEVSGTGTFTLEGTIAGVPLKITATGVQCASSVSACSIDGSSFGTNHSSGALKFTGVSVVTPPHCEVPTQTITTKALTGGVIMAGSNTYDKLVPASGSVVAEIGFATVAPGPCELEGVTAVLKGSATPKLEPTGVEIANQPLQFSAANQTAGGGSLAFGGIIATLTGSATTTLTTGQRYSAN